MDKKIFINNTDVIWGYIGTFVSLCANIITLPFIIYYLDGDMLGIWYIFVSIGAVSNLFDFGFSITFARNITYCWSGAKELKEENVEFVNNNHVNFLLLRDVIETCKWIYLIISLTALIIIGSIGTVYIIYISRNIRGYIHIVAWGIYLLSIFLNLYYGYYSAFLRGVGAIGSVNKNTIIARSAQIIFTIVVLILNGGILGATIGYLVYGFLFRILGKYKFYNYNHIGSKLKSIEEKIETKRKKELFKTVWHNAWRDGIVSLSNYFCNQAGAIICSFYLSLEETGIYSFGMQIATALVTVAAALYTTYQPAIQSSYVGQDREKTKKIMALIIYVYIIIFIIGLLMIIGIGLPILKVIKPGTVITVPVLLGICIAQFILQFKNCYTSYFSCTNRLPYVKSFLISAFLCIVLAYIFMGCLGLKIWGLILAQGMSQLVFNAWYWPKQVHKELEYSIRDIFVIGNKELKNILFK